MNRTAPEARLLIVEDEPNILELLTMALRFAGFEVTAAGTGPDAVNRARECKPDLVLLDVMLPGMDGFEVARTLRKDGQVPVIFLTAKDATEDKIQGLTIGGDDYITKPFSLEEVVARVRAVLRRTGGAVSAISASPAAQQEAATAQLAFADIVLDDDTHQVWKAGQDVELSPTEFKLLRFLLQNPGKVLSKRQILEHVWNYDFGGDGNVVESYISYLRKKLDTSEPRLLHTVRGVGYVLRAPKTSLASP